MRSDVSALKLTAIILILALIIGCKDVNNQNKDEIPSSIVPTQIKYENTLYTATGNSGTCGTRIGIAYDILSDGSLDKSISWSVYQEDSSDEDVIAVKTLRGCYSFVRSK